MRHAWNERKNDFDEEGGMGTVYKKASKFEENRHGVEFKKNGVFIQRQINGWCGTPPVTYEDYNGTWKTAIDDILDVEAGYWGGKQSFKLKIISVDNSSLRVRYIHPQNKL